MNPLLHNVSLPHVRQANRGGTETKNVVFLRDSIIPKVSRPIFTRIPFVLREAIEAIISLFPRWTLIIFLGLHRDGIAKYSTKDHGKKKRTRKFC